MAPARQASSPPRASSGNLTCFDKELFKTVSAEVLQKKLDQRESLDFLLIVDLSYQCFPKTEAFNANWTAFQVECDYFTDVVCTHHVLFFFLVINTFRNILITRFLNDFVKICNKIVGSRRFRWTLQGQIRLVWSRQEFGDIRIYSFVYPPWRSAEDRHWNWRYFSQGSFPTVRTFSIRILSRS